MQVAQFAENIFRADEGIILSWLRAAGASACDIAVLPAHI